MKKRFPRYRPGKSGPAARLAIVLLALLAGPAGVIRDPLHDATSRGRQHYDRKEFNQALEALGKGRETDPDHPVLAFGMGSTLLAMNKPDEALMEFGKALQSKDPVIRARTLYNMGNAWLQKQEYQKAIDQYRQSLLEDPTHAGAKRNLELARRLREQQQQQQQQSGDGKDGTQNQQQQNSQQEQSGRQKSGEEKQGDNQQSREEKGNQEKSQPQSGAEKPQNQKEQQARTGKEEKGNQEKQSRPARQLNEQQAAQLLQALARQEQAELQKMLQNKKKQPRKDGRDW